MTAIGLVLTALSGFLLVSELKKERAACARLEKQIAELQTELKRPATVPLLGEIPVVGRLFRQGSEDE